MTEIYSDARQGTEVLWLWERGELRVNNKVARLTAFQSDLFDLLLKKRGRVVMYDDIFRVFPINSEVTDQAGLIKVQLCHLRRKMREAGITEVEVRNVFSRGYVLCETDNAGYEREAANYSKALVVGDAVIEA